MAPIRKNIRGPENGSPIGWPDQKSQGAGLLLGPSPAQRSVHAGALDRGRENVTFTPKRGRRENVIFTPEDVRHSQGKCRLKNSPLRLLKP